jgi:hypothetical protein
MYSWPTQVDSKEVGSPRAGEMGPVAEAPRRGVPMYRLGAEFVDALGSIGPASAATLPGAAIPRQTRVPDSLDKDFHGRGQPLDRPRIDSPHRVSPLVLVHGQILCSPNEASYQRSVLTALLQGLLRIGTAPPHAAFRTLRGRVERLRKARREPQAVLAVRTGSVPGPYRVGGR